MLSHTVALYILIALLAVENIYNTTQCENTPTPRQSQLPETPNNRQNVYAFELSYAGYESPKMATAREILWKHYTNHTPATITLTGKSKEGGDFTNTYTIKNNENNEWVIILNITFVKPQYYMEKFPNEPPEITDQTIYNKVIPIKPPKNSHSPKKFISKDKLPNPKHYRLLLKTIKANEELIF